MATDTNKEGLWDTALEFAIAQLIVNHREELNNLRKENFNRLIGDKICDCIIPIPDPNSYNPKCLKCGRYISL